MHCLSDVRETIRNSGARGAEGRPAYRLVLEKYHVDELYDASVRESREGSGQRRGGVRSGVVDGGVNGAGWTTRIDGGPLAAVGPVCDRWVVNLMGFGAKVFSYPMRILQTGLVQNYAMFIVLGVLAFLAYYFCIFDFGSSLIKVELGEIR